MHVALTDGVLGPAARRAPDQADGVGAQGETDGQVIDTQCAGEQRPAGVLGSCSVSGAGLDCSSAVGAAVAVGPSEVVEPGADQQLPAEVVCALEPSEPARAQPRISPTHRPGTGWRVTGVDRRALRMLGRLSGELGAR